MPGDDETLVVVVLELAPAQLGVVVDIHALNFAAPNISDLGQLRLDQLRSTHLTEPWWEKLI